MSGPAIRRGLAQALLPASILPVLLLGPGLVRSPERLFRQASAELQRLTDRGGGGGTVHHRRPALSTPTAPAVSTTTRGATSR